MAIKKRSDLKKFFASGSIPTESNFADLIDSFVHIGEDNWINQDDGLRVCSMGDNSKLMSFFKSINDKSPVFSLRKFPSDGSIYGLDLVNENGESSLYIRGDGFVGVGSNDPQCRLDIDGYVQSTGRRGTYKFGDIPGDGMWHVIVDSLTDCHVFEIVAKINKPGKGMHSIIHAIAAGAFNGKCNEINVTKAYYDSRRDQIELKWNGGNFNYRLEARTKRNYGENTSIKYYVTNLWW